MVSLSVAIMAHPDRSAFIPTLQSRLGSQVPVIFDQKNDRWDTGRRSLLAYDPDATHHLVIQDDALPAPHLLLGLTRWIPRLPESALCLYSGNIRHFRSIYRQKAKPPCFLQMRQLQWGVAVVLPTKHIPEIVEMGDSLSKIGNYDMRITMWCVENALPVLYPQRCWVDHRKTPSLVPGRSPARQALYPWPHSIREWGRRVQKPTIVACPEFQRHSGGREFYPNLKGTHV